MTVATSERESIQTSPFRYPGSVVIVAFCTALATGCTAAAYHEADLNPARLGVRCIAADLSRADLSGHFFRQSLKNADLRGANL